MGRWTSIILRHVRPILKEFSQRGLKPTVRGTFYILVSKGIIKKEEREYKNLVKGLTTARKSQLIRRDAFSDNSRQIVKEFEDRYLTIDQVIDKTLQRLLNIQYKYKEMIPLWHNQPNYVEVWLEKDAMAGILASLLSPLQIVLVPNRGWRSITFLEKNADRLMTQLEDGKNVYILYCGDFDPSGLRMDELFKKELPQRIRSKSRLGQMDKMESRLHFGRIALTEEQLDRYYLRNLENPDPDVIKKLRVDKNSEWFENKYGSLFQIQLDVLQTIPPEEFTNIIQQPILELYDKSIHEQVLQLPEHSLSREDIVGKIRDKINDIL